MSQPVYLCAGVSPSMSWSILMLACSSTHHCSRRVGREKTTRLLATMSAGMPQSAVRATTHDPRRVLRYTCHNKHRRRRLMGRWVGGYPVG